MYIHTCIYIPVHTYVHFIHLIMLLIVGTKRHSTKKTPPSFGECFWQLEKTDTPLRGKLVVMYMSY